MILVAAPIIGESCHKSHFCHDKQIFGERLGETTFDKPERKADGIRTRNSNLVFEYPDYHGCSECSSSVSSGSDNHDMTFLSRIVIKLIS